jgi:hypothetical protein
MFRMHKSATQEKLNSIVIAGLKKKIMQILNEIFRSFKDTALINLFNFAGAGNFNLYNKLSCNSVICVNIITNKGLDL